MASFQVLCKHVRSTSDLHFSGPACWLSWRLLFIYCSNFDNFLLSFFKGSNNFLFLFPEIGNKYSSIFDVVTHKAWVCHQVNAFKFSRMVHYNHRSLMILVNDAKYIYLPIFSASSIEPLSYCKYKTFINSSAYFTTNFY